MSQFTESCFTIALGVDIEPSKALRIALLVCYDLAATVCLLLPVDLVIRSVLFGLSAIYGIYQAVYKNGPRNPQHIHRIDFSNEQGWQLHFISGNRANTNLRLPVLITPQLVIARFGTGFWPQYTAVIPKDSADPVSFRHLRVRLLQCAYGY